MVQNKTYRLEPPELNWEMSMALLIGYTDGDGCINLNKDHGLSFKWCSCSENMLTWIQDIIDNKMELFQYAIKANYKKRNINFSTQNCKNFGVTGLQASILFDYLRQINVYKMPRKWDRPEILEFVDQQKQKFPEK